MSDKEEYIRRLDKIERDIEWIIQYLLKKDATPQQPPYVPAPPISNGTICVKCGMKWEGAMAYVCTYGHCPMQLKTTTYVSTTTGDKQ